MNPKRWRSLLPALLVFALLATLYPGALLRGEIFLSADAQSSDALRQVGDAGRVSEGYPHWNPYLFLGMPTFGSLAYTPGLYPPSLVFEFLQRQLRFPPLTWLLGHLLFGGLGMFWLLGRWRLPLAARALGAVGWLAFAGTVSWAVHGHGSKLGAAMYMPWLVGLAWNVLTTGRPGSAALFGLLLGLQVLRGHVQITYYTLLLAGWLTAWHLIWPLQEMSPRLALGVRARRAGLLVAGLVCGLLVGAVLLLPVHEYAGISTRGQGDAGGGAGFDYATAWSLGIAELPSLVQPGAAGFGKATYLGPMPFTDYPNYFGWLWLALAVAAWASGRRSLVLCLAGATLISLLVALGRESPGVFQAFYAALPYFDKFRVPLMILVLAALVLGILAPLGAQALTGDEPGRDRWRRWFALALAVVGGLTFLAGATGATAGAFRDRLAELATASGKQPAPILLDEAWRLQRGFLVRDGLILLAAAAAVFAASRRAGFRRRALGWVLAVLLAADLLSVAHLITHPERGLFQVVSDRQGGGRLAPAGQLARPFRPQDAASQIDPALGEALRDAVGHGRVYPLDAYHQSNALMTAGVRSLGGYYPAKPAVVEQIRRRLFSDTPAGRIANWLAGAAVTLGRQVPAEALPQLRDLGLDLAPDGVQRGETWIYRNRAALPRARLIDSWQPAHGDLESLLDDIAAGRHDPGATVLLQPAPEPAPRGGAASLAAPVFVRDGLDEVVLRTEADRPTVLVLADLAAPGWRVMVDGGERPLLLADHALRAVALPAGSHEVRFEFSDPSVRRGLGLAAAGIAGILALGIVAWMRRGERRS